MEEFVVREVCEGDEAARREVVDAATRELRSTYRPRENRDSCGEVLNSVLVALKEQGVVGTAEYIRKDHHIYVQGVAVHPEYRVRGVCRALLRRIEEIAKSEGFRLLALCAIEETGNVEIFKNLGFKAVKRVTAPNHISPSGAPVTQVDMEKEIA
jgi:N-acetylglutamate synthase-like GNAT family acetyltransferase